MGEALSHTLVAGERVSLCCAITSVICCMVATILTILGIGVGLGYNHCFLDMKTRNRYVPSHYEGTFRWPRTRQMEQLVKTVNDVDNDIFKEDIISDVTAPIEEPIDKRSYKKNGTLIYETENSKHNSDYSDISLNVSTINSANRNNNMREEILYETVPSHYVTNSDYFDLRLNASASNTANINNNMRAEFKKESINASTINKANTDNKMTPEFKKSEEKIQTDTNKESIPIAGLNIIDLISKLKKSNNSYSIQIIKH